MGRPKNFTRTGVLQKAIPVFWERGYADTGLHDLEQATGVNKSGLYAEFESKEELFLACLKHYLDNSPARATLSAEPLGWDNIEKVLMLAVACRRHKKGCFAINSMREFHILPAKAHEIVAQSKHQLKHLLEKNVRAEPAHLDPVATAEMISTFLSGLCLEQNLSNQQQAAERKVENLMRLLRAG